MIHEPYCNTNISCLVYHANGICPDKRPCDCGAEDILKKGFVQGGETEFDIYHSKTMPLSTACPLTNSSHEKALVRVVEETKILAIDDKGEITASECTEFIQVLCACGYTISACEIKNK